MALRPLISQLVGIEFVKKVINAIDVDTIHITDIIVTVFLWTKMNKNVKEKGKDARQVGLVIDSI